MGIYVILLSLLEDHGLKKKVETVIKVLTAIKTLHTYSPFRQK